MSDDEETTGDAEPNIISGLLTLGERVRTLALEPPSGAWFAMWGPVLGAVARLAKTLLNLALRLKAATAADDPIQPIDAELRAELSEELRDIADEFPDVADVLFGLPHLDLLWEALNNDADARTAASALLGSLGSVLDRFLGTLVDIAVGHRQTEFGAEKVVSFLERYEDVAQRLIDQWLVPALGMGPTDPQD